MRENREPVWPRANIEQSGNKEREKETDGWLPYSLSNLNSTVSLPLGESQLWTFLRAHGHKQAINMLRKEMK